MAQRPRPKPIRNRKAFGEATFVALNIPYHSMKILAEPDENGSMTVRLIFVPPLKGLALTSLTTEELDAFHALVQSAVELARPICEELDETAQKEYSNGISLNTRLYRQLPVVSAFPRHVEAHAEGLPKRFDLVSYMARLAERFARWPQLGHLAGAGEGSGSLLERAEGDAYAEHDHPEAWDAEGLR